MSVERLAELGEIDLVGEIVERHECPTSAPLRQRAVFT
jgi:hypothetical protein